MTDRFTVNAVVVGLILATLMSIALGGYLTAVNQPIPDFIVSAGSTSLGALGALLARTSNEVKVTNSSTDPVPTTEA